MFDKTRFLGHLDGDEREQGSRILDLASEAYTENRPAYSDFLDPRGQEIAVGIVRGVGSLNYQLSGGYRGAERQRLAIFPDYYPLDGVEIPLAAIDIDGTADFSHVAHRDVLGAVLGCGIKREKTGDVLMTGRGAQVIMIPEIVPAVVHNLQAVQKVPVFVAEIDLEQLEAVPKRVKEIRATVASLRLDAVASAGYGTSRSQMAREIRGGKVKVDWKPIDNPAHGIEVGDVVSIRGRGRLEVAEQLGLTRKGRISVLLKRYI
ncbi:MAG: photosystem II S4 domain protein [Firmicutes bacterium]|mgnify:FL=1|nr:photosystem II S4 domain protein [Bacillota bacterium]